MPLGYQRWLHKRTPEGERDLIRGAVHEVAHKTLLLKKKLSP